MSARKLTTRSLGLAVALALVAVPLAAQQDTTKLRRTTSDRRINVSKGEVEMPPRVDTVYVTRSDTVREQLLRIDTVTVVQPPPVIPQIPLGDWYWGIYAGGTGPVGTIDHVNTNGYHAGVVGGWDPRTSWFGARFNITYSQIGREQGLPVALVGTELPQLWQFALDLKPKANFGGWSLYGIGGLGWDSYKRLATVSDNPFDNNVIQPINNTLVVPFDATNADDITACGRFDADNNINDNNNLSCYRLATDGWRSKFSWNFGAGTDFHIGRQDMFLEIRWNPISTHGTYTWYMPISLGLRYF